MNQMKSSKEGSPRVGIVSAMRPVWRVGIPATTAFSAVLAVVFAIALDGCSGTKNNRTEVTSPNHISIPENTGPGAVSAIPTDVLKPQSTGRKNSAVVHRAAFYNDDTYGVSFRYPKTYALLTPEKTVTQQALERIPMNFVQPGGVSLATIALPGGPVTPLFHVNVNKNLTAAECRQFAVPDASDVAGSTPITDGVSRPVKVNLRGGDFMTVENGSEQNDLRYYHHFENGACYEFVMAVQETDGNTKPVDHFVLFDQLEQIMATVKIKPESAAPVTAGLPRTPARGSNPQ